MRETDLRICDLKRNILNMAPVFIAINGKRVWTDDIDLTNVPDEQASQMIKENIEKLNEVLYREDLVWKIEFTIIHHHHSAVYIKTI